MKRLSHWFAACSLLAAAGCSSQASETESLAAQRAPLSAAVTVDFTAREQRMTGFGASSAWTTTSVDDDQADFLFTEQGLGISILRLRITPEGTSDEIATAQAAAKRGVMIWAAPWSPPGEWKTSGTATNGGSLLPEHYQDWADRLASFVRLARASGVPISALSVQNEPDWTADWETCVWTPTELLTFLRDYLAPALAAASPETRLLGPETADWNHLQRFANPILEDPVAQAAVPIIATHAYGGIAQSLPTATEMGKELWETEVSFTGDQDVSSTIATAELMHSHVTTANVNAWHYWWINAEDGTGLYNEGVITRQAWGFAHFSRFVRPGFYRVEADPSQPTSGVSVSAFSDPKTGRVALVAINRNPSTVTLDVDFSGVTVGPVTPWVTTEGIPLAQRSPIEGKTLEYNLPASSVVTFTTTRPPDEPSGGTGGAPSIEGGAGGEAGESSAGADAGGADSGDAGGSGGVEAEPASGGAPTASGGRTTSLGGSPSETGSGGTTTGSSDDGGNVGRPPQQGFLPGCYCTTSGPMPSSSEPFALFGSIAGLVGVAARLRRRRSFS